MTNMYDMVVSVISKPVDLRQDFEIQTLVPWFRKKSEKLFRELKTEYLKDIIRNCQIVHHQRDDVIIKQGERGDCFYIILSGQISIFILDKDKESEDGEESSEQVQIYKKDGKLDRTKLGYHVTQLGAGIPFGEVALASEDCIRTASITADENTDLIVVDRALYNRSVRDVLAEEFATKKRFIEENSLFSSWSPKYRKQLTMALYQESYPYEAVLVRQGDPVNNIYFITGGQTEVQIDPFVHPYQYSKIFKAANQTQADKIMKRERHTRPPTEAQLCNIKKRDNIRSTKLCYLGLNECLGDAEVLLDLNTYMQTAVCKERTKVLVLEVKHYIRLFVRRHQRTIDTMRNQLGVKLEARISLLPHKHDIPLLGYLGDIIETKSRPQVGTEKDKRELVTVSEAEKEFFNHKGPLIDMYGPGSVFYVIRVRERTKLKLRNKKERTVERPMQGHMHALPVPQSMLMGARFSPPSRSADSYWRPLSSRSETGPRSFRTIAEDEECYDPELPDDSEYTDPSSVACVIDQEAQNAALTNLEERINSWLQQDNPKGGPRVERLRRYVNQDLQNPPHPGNRIILRRRRSLDCSPKERSPKELEKERLAHLKILLSR